MRTRMMIGACVAWLLLAVAAGCQAIAGLGNPELARDGGTGGAGEGSGGDDAGSSDGD